MTAICPAYLRHVYHRAGTALLCRIIRIIPLLSVTLCYGYNNTG